MYGGVRLPEALATIETMLKLLRQFRPRQFPCCVPFFGFRRQQQQQAFPITLQSDLQVAIECLDGIGDFRNPDL